MLRLSSLPQSRYKTSNWGAHNKALKPSGALTVWLDADVTWLKKPIGKRDRQSAYRDAAIQAGLTLKSLVGRPFGQAMENLLAQSGLP